MKTNQFELKKTHSRNANLNFIFRRSYSTSSSSNLDIPIPVLTITDLQDKNIVFSKRDLPKKILKKKKNWKRRYI
jgi:hypothetical protein